MVNQLGDIKSGSIVCSDSHFTKITTDFVEFWDPLVDLKVMITLAPTPSCAGNESRSRVDHCRGAATGTCRYIVPP
jgi:hypothetical protein